MATIACPRCTAPLLSRPPLGQPAVCGECGHTWKLPSAKTFPSDEYMPVEPGTRSHAPLTERKEAGPPVQFAPPRQASSSSGRARAAKETVPQPEEDSDLFERAERSAREDRSRLRTMPEIPAEKMSCPVCGYPEVPLAADGSRTCPQCGTSVTLHGQRLTAAARRPPGDPLLGRTLRGCLIDRKIGEGGMGAVYHARQLSLDRSVAIKVLPPDLARNQGFITRFEREAKSLARINHPNILQIYDFGEDKQLGIYFMVIEFVDGRDLGDVLGRHLTISQLETLDLLRQAVQGLEQAAQKGVIHRDIKPDNLMITTDGVVKVSDFGLAKGMGATNEVTSIGVRVGTPAFMSPEQCDGVEVDGRSDIYNLGCTAFLCLTGLLPFDGDTPFAIMLKHKSEAPQSIIAINPAIDPRVETLVHRMLAKKPADRCVSLRLLIDEIEDLLIAIAGTSSILRKTRGPMRAMAAPGQGSSSASRVAVVREPSGVRPAQPAQRPDPPKPAAPPRPARQASPPAPRPAPQPPAPAPTSQPKPPAAAAIPAATGIDSIPDWLKPLDMPVHASQAPAAIPPLVAEPQPQPTGAGSSTSRPMVGAIPVGQQSPVSGLGQRASRLNLPTVGGAAAAGSSPPAPPSQLGSSSGMLPPLASKDAPVGSRSSRMLTPGVSSAATRSSAELDGRRRGRRAEVADLVASADRLSAAGAHAKAADELERAASMANSTEAADQLRARAVSVRARSQQRSGLRWAMAAGVVGVVGLNLWIWPPVIHNQLADRSLARILSIPDQATRSQSLREFLSTEVIPWSWYVGLFRSDYQVRAEAQATSALPSTKAPGVLPADRRREKPALRLTKLIDDTRVAWPDILAEAKRIGEAADKDKDLLGAVAAVTTRAEKEIAAIADDVAKVAALRGAGRHGEALKLAAQLSTHHPRAGTLLAELPEPVQVQVMDADRTEAVASPTVTADGVEILDGVTVARPPGQRVRLAVSAPGFVNAMVELVPSESARRIDLTPAPVWIRQVARPSKQPALWSSLRTAGTRLVLQRQDGLSGIVKATGETAAVATTSESLTPWWREDEAGFRLTTLGGQQLRLTSDLGKLERVANDGGPSLTRIDGELFYQPGRRVSFSVEPSREARMVVARSGPTELWRVDGLGSQAEPLLVRQEEVLTIVDDARLLAVDELGKTMQQVQLKGVRIATPVLVNRGLVVVTASAAAVEAFRLGTGTSPINPIESQVFGQSGAVALVADGDSIALARADGTVELATWLGGGFSIRWRTKLATVTATLALDRTTVAAIDGEGRPTLLETASGQVIRRFPQAEGPVAAAVLSGRQLLVASPHGQVTAYAVPGAAP